jgi:hypothetical protein
MSTGHIKDVVPEETMTVNDCIAVVVFFALVVQVEVLITQSRLQVILSSSTE